MGHADDRTSQAILREVKRITGSTGGDEEIEVVTTTNADGQVVRMVETNLTTGTSVTTTFTYEVEA